MIRFLVRNVTDAAYSTVMQVPEVSDRHYYAGCLSSLLLYMFQHPRPDRSKIKYPNPELEGSYNVLVQKKIRQVLLHH
jgi:hypothetical protein